MLFWQENCKENQWTYTKIVIWLKAMKPGEVQTYLPPPPHQIVEYLNGHIIGHYVMKKAISVAIYNHFCNINFSRWVEYKNVNYFLKEIFVPNLALHTFPILNLRYQSLNNHQFQLEISNYMHHASFDELTFWTI